MPESARPAPPAPTTTPPLAGKKSLKAWVRDHWVELGSLVVAILVALFLVFHKSGQTIAAGVPSLGGGGGTSGGTAGTPTTGSVPAPPSIVRNSFPPSFLGNAEDSAPAGVTPFLHGQLYRIRQTVGMGDPGVAFESAPGGSILNQLPFGSEIQLLGNSKVGPDGTTWQEALWNGVAGWISGGDVVRGASIRGTSVGGASPIAAGPALPRTAGLRKAPPARAAEPPSPTSPPVTRVLRVTQARRPRQ